ncbi:SGNH/GDSL hydrolase family protein [Oleiharenicola lentus]|uniref:SGNH/GDSL hydrolase family protein n=1 Tax=Oleiharenicola lentus TaxID=2508720 RepID=UPI003F660FAC
MSTALQTALSRPRARVVFYGTSLTKSGGWVEILADELAARCSGIVVTNAASNGQHSRWGVENLDERVLAANPDVLFIEFAINDAVARFALSLEDARTNLIAMIDRVRATLPECIVVLQVMNPVIGRPAGHDGHRPNLARYEQGYRDVARERGLLLIDHAPAWATLLAIGEIEFSRHVPDGLHPSVAAYEQFMLPTLRAALRPTDSARD